MVTTLLDIHKSNIKIRAVNMAITAIFIVILFQYC